MTAEDIVELDAGAVQASVRVLAAFAADGVLEREFALPEISTELRFPAAQAIRFHFVDYVVHGWDVARALGVGYDLEPGLLAAALPIARAVPDAGPTGPRPTSADRGYSVSTACPHSGHWNGRRCAMDRTIAK